MDVIKKGPILVYNYDSVILSYLILSYLILSSALITKKVQVGKDQERRNQKKIPTPNTRGGKKQNNNQVHIP